MSALTDACSLWYASHLFWRCRGLALLALLWSLFFLPIFFFNARSSQGRSCLPLSTLVGTTLFMMPMTPVLKNCQFSLASLPEYVALKVFCSSEISTVMYGMTLLVHSHTSTVAPLPISYAYECPWLEADRLDGETAMPLHLLYEIEIWVSQKWDGMFVCGRKDLM